MKKGDDDHGYIIEFISMGDYVKVSAIDPATRREASIVGDPAAGKDALSRLAVRKLHYVMNKKKS